MAARRRAVLAESSPDVNSASTPGTRVKRDSPSRARAALRRESALAQRASELRTQGIELRAKSATSPRAKFHNVKAVYGGVTYDSAGEAAYAWKLDQMVKRGEIVDWERPAALVLVDAPKLRERITYKPDFYVIPSSDSEYSYYVDYKGSRITETAAWRLKVKLWKRAIPYELRVAYPNGEEKVVCTGQESFGDAGAGISLGSTKTGRQTTTTEPASAVPVRAQRLGVRKKTGA